MRDTGHMKDPSLNSLIFFLPYQWDLANPVHIESLRPVSNIVYTKPKFLLQSKPTVTTQFSE